MIRKVYLFIIIGFAVFVIVLNAVTVIMGAKSRQIINIFYMSERAAAVMLFFEHIIFESGVILSHPNDEEIRLAVWEECSGTPIDPELVMLIIGGNRLFSIDFDGSMGLMRVKSHMLRDMLGSSPFVLNDNIRAGVAYLIKLMEKEGALDIALCEYFKPVSSKTVFESDIKASNAYAVKIYNDYIKLNPQIKLRPEPALPDILPAPAYL